DLPFPAGSHEPRIQQLADDLEAAGYRPFHAPCGIRLNEPDMPHSVCVRCQNCDGFPCVVHGKSDAEVLGVRPALEHSNVTLLTNSQAVKLETNEAGTAVTDVVVGHNGPTERYPADTKLAPQWSLEKVAKHAIDFWLSTEDLPLPENRVTVDGDGKLTIAYKPSNDVPKQQLYDKLKSILGKLRMEPDHLFGRFAYLKNDIPVAGCAHQAGTVRFGADAATSALNVDCRAHELDNL